MIIRPATATDIPAITGVVNRANLVEAFFVDGDRTDQHAVGVAMRDGTFLVAEDAGAIIGAVHLEKRDDAGHFSMLAVEPARQGDGVGYRLVRAAEAEFQMLGLAWSELEMVNLREELLPYYERLGYRVVGTAPYVEWREAKLPVHFIIMRKPLAPLTQGDTDDGRDEAPGDTAH